MEESFASFDLGITWSQFGNGSRASLDKLLNFKSELTPQQKYHIEELWDNHPNRQIWYHGVVRFWHTLWGNGGNTNHGNNGSIVMRSKESHSGVAFVFETINPTSPALKSYIKTGNKLKDANSECGMSTIEDGVAQFVESVKESGFIGEVAVFSYLYGSSGLGKTQLAFALKRSVLYIPLGNSQPIYRCFERLTSVVREAVVRDQAILRTAEIKYPCSGNASLFSATYIESSLSDYGRLKYFTVSVLLQLLKLFVSSRAHDPNMTNVFLGADCDVQLHAMTLNEGRRAAEKYRDVLIFLDEVPPKDQVHMTTYYQCLFLCNLIRCLALPCLLSGTESALLDVNTIVHGSRSEGREPWAWLLTKFPACLLDVPRDRFGDYEQHLLHNTRPLLARWFTECCDALSPSSTGYIRMTPATLSGMKRKSCEAKLNLVPSGHNGDQPWLFASFLLVFTDSLGGGEKTDSIVCADSTVSVGEKRAASASADSPAHKRPQSMAPQGTREKQKVNSISGNNILRSMLIRHHFALHRVRTERINEHGMSVLYKEGYYLQHRDHTPFKADASFPTCTADPLLYLACLRGGLMCRDTGVNVGELVQVPSSYALNLIRTQSNLSGSETKLDDSMGLDAECAAALVLAAHRYTTFTGTPFFRWLALVVAELSPQLPFLETEITSIPEELCIALQDVMVPLLSPPNCPWGKESMQSGFNFGDLVWYEAGNHQYLDITERNDSGLWDVNEGKSMIARGHTVRDAKHNKDITTVNAKFGGCSVCLLIGSDLSVWQRQQHFSSDVSAYRMTPFLRRAITRLSPPVAAADWLPGRKVLIALDLKTLH